MTDPSAIVGICEVVREGYPDHTALDPKDEYYDADSDPEHPTWYMVDLRAVASSHGRSRGTAGPCGGAARHTGCARRHP